MLQDIYNHCLVADSKKKIYILVYLGTTWGLYGFLWRTEHETLLEVECTQSGLWVFKHGNFNVLMYVSMKFYKHMQTVHVYNSMNTKIPSHIK